MKALTAKQEQLARFAKALGHPVRIAILQMLATKTCCYPGDMADNLPIAKSTLSQHLNELKEVGLIRQELITLPTIKYCLCKKNWKIAKELFDTLSMEIMQTDK